MREHLPDRQFTLLLEPGPYSRVLLFPRRAVTFPPYGRGAGRGARSSAAFGASLSGVLTVATAADFITIEGRVAWGRIRNEVALPEAERTKLRDACKEQMISLGAESTSTT